MSCLNATAPINIQMTDITGKCDYKCSFSFHYANSSCVATNRGDYISLSYDNSNHSSIKYNSTSYNVSEVRIYTPSIHTYSGNATDGECIIVHTSVSGLNPLFVCIPIRSNSIASPSASFFQSVVSALSNNAPVEGDTTPVNINDYNLSTFVPKTPFFSYSATELFQPCYAKVDYIVFHPSNTTLDILPDTLTVLHTLIANHSYTINDTNNTNNTNNTNKKVALFYNEKGARNGEDGGDQIYIDCQPVGASEETTDIVVDTGGTPVDWMKNPLVQLILGSFLFILLLYGLKYVLNLLPASTQSILGDKKSPPFT